ncbi:DUF6056 family protein [Vagococcus lutrae]|uniref:DUF6056 family protein n=1 Tax=Vagococcus lutrae TaxID=81947 RepID=UPI00288D2EC7|nr:DUF6056 family protein [Vagococcus lutrae]MDT2808593.1 DUF6056 family protein [Vagococcus lutrae]
MKYKKVKVVNYWKIIVWILPLFIVLCVLNANTFYATDDLFYRFKIVGQFHPDRSSHILSIQDLIESQRNHFYVMNGRIFPHLLLQVMMQFSKSIFNVLNSLIFISCVFLMYKVMSIFADKKASYLFIFLSYFIFFTMPDISNVFLWVSGATNYIWMSTFSLLFLLMMMTYDKIPLIIILLFSFAIGNSNESNGPVYIMLISLLLLLYKLFYQKKLSIKKIMLVIIGGISGFLFGLQSPRTIERRAVYDISLESIIYSCKKLWAVYTTDGHLFLLSLSLLLMVILLFNDMVLFEEKVIIYSLLSIHILSLLPILTTVEITARSIMASTIILYLLLFYLLLILLKKIETQITFVSYKPFILMVLSFIVFMSPVLIDSFNYRSQINYIVNDIEEQRNKGIDDVTIGMPSYEMETRFLKSGMINTTYYKLWLAKFYNVSTIEFDPEKTELLSAKFRFEVPNIYNSDYMKKDWVIEDK